MPYYETVLIARQDLSEAQVKEITESCEKIIKDAKGKVTKTENWGLRTLAYRIQKNRKGYYALIESDTPSEAIAEIERTLGLNEDVLRFITIRLDEPTKGPSIMMAKNDRDTGEDSSSKNKREAA